ncbi:E3 ubiquitin-protein ligase TRIM7-like [Ambystoma mexicanum]|uniref:E3 ubiquitin-protein ligase TRIM7-like n=1 Tax=Ambystoma mexicanum TaxID=8296 RepID=UPI0037E94AD0
MAVVGPVRELQDETVCSLCTSYFEDPVAIDCDHSYCRACIIGHWREAPAGAFVCPQCRQTFSRMHLRTNVQLSVMVKIAKNLNFAPEKTARRPPAPQRSRVRSMEYNQGKKECQGGASGLCSRTER